MFYRLQLGRTLSWSMLVAWVEERYRTSCPSFDTCHAISPISPVNELKKNFPTTWKRTQSGRTLSDLVTKPSAMLPSRFSMRRPFSTVIRRMFSSILHSRTADITNRAATMSVIVRSEPNGDLVYKGTAASGMFHGKGRRPPQHESNIWHRGRERNA